LANKEAELIVARRAGTGSTGSEGAPDGRLPPDTVGLALSGGGIRSATFCLGVLQAMARTVWLPRVDLLSTVSGGGYIGSFLGRLHTRTWVRQADAGPTAAIREALTNAHSEPLRWLRDNGRYLSPNGAGDTWLAVAVMLRNLVALHVVLGTLVLGLVLFADLVRAVLGPRVDAELLLAAPPGSAIWWSPWIALPGLTFVLLVVPLGWAYWFDQVDTKGRPAPLPPLAGASAALVCLCAGWMVGQGLLRAGLLSLGLLVVEALLWITLAWRLGRLEGLSGSTERRFRANRVSRWLMQAVMVTLALLAFGLVDSLGQTLYAVVERIGLGPVFLRPTTLPPLAALAGLLASLRVLAPLLDRFAGSDRWKLRWNVLVNLLAVLALAVALPLTAAAGHAIAWRFAPPQGDPGAALRPLEPAPEGEAGSVQVVVQTGVAPGAILTPGPGSGEDRSPAHRSGERRGGDGGQATAAMSVAWCAVGLLICLALSLVFAHSVYFLNLSSHLTLYSARIARAYLGASNPARWTPAGMHLTDVVDCDGLRWDDYRPHDGGGPLHLVNLTVNETVSGTSRIEHRDRKGLQMAVGPCGLSVGARFHGLWVAGCSGRQSFSALLEPLGFSPGRFHALAGATDEPHPVQPRCLEQWVATSGAAFTTGLGWRTSLGASLLLGLGNVRLGHWWDSHISPGQRQGTPPPTPAMRLGRLWTALFPVQSYLLDELLARFHGPGRQYWYLSDGGHFENTGCYELIRRRVPFIICCDCGADPDYQFEDVANLARRVRTDFGAELELTAVPPSGAHQWRVAWSEIGELRGIGRASKPEPPEHPSATSGDAHATVAVVTYPEPDSKPSVVLFLKPSLTGDEPVDLLNYATTHPAFPQEPTTDQFFDEAQWESYRKLGEHIGGVVLRTWCATGESLPECASP